jgi:hypothetical protein
MKVEFRVGRSDIRVDISGHRRCGAWHLAIQEGTRRHAGNIGEQNGFAMCLRSDVGFGLRSALSDHLRKIGQSPILVPARDVNPASRWVYSFRASQGESRRLANYCMAAIV